MNYDDYMELFHTPTTTFEEEYEDWLRENCPEPTNEELQEMYEDFHGGDDK